MRIFFAIIFYMSLLSFSFGQFNGLSWKKNYGGSQFDLLGNTIETSDGGYLLIGGTNSNDINVSGWHVGYDSNNDPHWDAWVVKLDNKGNIEWQKCLGGSNYDFAVDAVEASNGDLYVACYSKSTDGDVSLPKGDDDFWLVKLSSLGSIIWERSFGGSDDDNVKAIELLSDGSLLLVGDSRSSDGNLNGNNGSRDGWVVKVNSQGWLQWQAHYGGSSADNFQAAIELASGDLLIIGSSRSSDGDLNSNAGQTDAWVLRLNGANGQLISSNEFGGAGHDIFYRAIEKSDGSLVLIGSSSSSNGDVVGWHSGTINGQNTSDAWVVGIASTLGMQWQKCIGGSGEDGLYNVLENSNGNLVIVGATNSSDGDLNGYNVNNYDGWIVSLNSGHNIEWQRVYGGDSLDVLISIIESSDGAYVFGGYTNSISGDVAFNYGLYDFWLLKTDCYNIDLGATDLGICPGSTPQLTVNGSYVYYAWNTGASSPTIDITQAGQYYVEISDSNACKGRSDTINAFYYVNPQVNLILNGSNSICIGESRQIDATNNFTAYNWNNGSSSSSITVSTPGQYWVTVTDTNGCSNVSDTISIYSASINGAQLQSTMGSTLCPGQYTELSVQGAFVDYSWSNGDTASVISVSSPGAYYALVVDAFGCASYTDTLVITVNASNFNLDFEVDVSSLTTPPFEVEYNNTTPVMINMDFTWFFGDGDSIQSNAYYVQHTYAHNGLYDVALVAENIISSCKDTLMKEQYVSCSGGVDNNIEKLNEDDFYIAIKEKVLFVKSLKGNIKEITLFNVVGSEILSLNNINSQYQEIDVSSFIYGNYFLRIKTENRLIIKRF